MLFSFSRVPRSHDAATHAHNGVFSLWPLPTTLYFFLFLCSSACCSIILPAVSLNSSPLLVLPQSVFLTISSPFTISSSSKSLMCVHPSFPHPTIHLPCSWLTGIHPQAGHITPLWIGRRSERVPTGGKSECVLAVWQYSATWTEAWAGTSSLTPELLIQSHHWCFLYVCMYVAVRK